MRVRGTYIHARKCSVLGINSDAVKQLLKHARYSHRSSNMF